jgi:GxxExxY protein
MEFDVLSREVIGAAIEVHRSLGPGLLESAYEGCLAHELSLRGIPFQRQLDLPLDYKGFSVTCGYRIDLLVNDSIVIEIKSVEMLKQVHVAQLLTYMKLGEWPIGLIINFNTPVLRSGIRRLVL